jgi:hypothetical protein
MRVMVAIPTMTNRITVQIVALLDAMRVTSFDDDAAFGMEFCIEVGRSPVEFARNILCGAFLKSDCDKLLFIDEDMLPESSVVRLIYSDSDIISARMYKFDHPNPEKRTTVGLGLCAMRRLETGFYRPLAPEIGDHAVQECDAVGTACTVISRRVIEDRRMWSDNVYVTADGNTVDGNEMVSGREFAPNIFQYPRAPNGMGIMGEDIDFCERAKALGYKISVDMNAVCGHWKSIDIDQAGFLAQETLKRAVAGITLEDGRTIQVDLASSIKSSKRPPVDKMVHAENAVCK